MRRQQPDGNSRCDEARRDDSGGANHRGGAADDRERLRTCRAGRRGTNHRTRDRE
jgi:hypothetical protein